MRASARDEPTASELRRGAGSRGAPGLRQHDRTLPVRGREEEEEGRRLEEELYSYTDHETQQHRLLAAGSGPPIANEADRRQRVAHFFCISMALVWLCLDAMLLANRGIFANIKRCHSCPQATHLFKFCILIVIVALFFVFFCCILRAWNLLETCK